jgi:hypothetical protein
MSDAPVSTPSGRPHRGEPHDDPQPMSLGRRAARLLGLLAAIGIAALWAYALWGPTEKTFPGTLTDPTFAEQAQPICSATAGRLAELQPAYESRDAGARAEVVAQANTELRSMVEELASIAPSASSGEDGQMVQEWLGDWRTYLDDRERYVEALSDDPDARFYVTEKEGRQVTEPIDFFAGRANDMTDCVTPGDLA